MFDIHYFDEIDSTMNVARDQAAHGLVVQAGQQISGRGRRGNQWSSPEGNLYQSIVLKPITSKEKWGQLSFVMAVALGKTIENHAIYNLKWPNDVLIHDQKLAGILIETHNDFVIIGVGVNIEHAPQDRAKINDFWDISVNDFRDLFLIQIEAYYKMWEEGDFADIRNLWMEHAYRLQQTIQARLPNAIYDGIFEGLDENGVLLLREKNGSLRQINSGEILHVFSD